MNDDTSLGDIFKMGIGVAVIGLLGHGIVKYFKCDDPLTIFIHFGSFILAGLGLGAVVAHVAKDEQTSWIDEFFSVAKWTCLIALIGWMVFGGIRGCGYNLDESSSRKLSDPYPGETEEQYFKRMGENLQLYEDYLKKKR